MRKTKPSTSVPQICKSNKSTRAGSGRSFQKNRANRKERRDAKKFLDDAPKKRTYWGYD